MNRRLARRYAHDVILRALDGSLEDDEWLSTRFTPEELGVLLAEVKVLRQRHIDAHAVLPLPREEPTHAVVAGEAKNVCEHGDHPAPEGKRFCSMACAKCEYTDYDATTGECSGLCLSLEKKERTWKSKEQPKKIERQ